VTCTFTFDAVDARVLVRPGKDDRHQEAESLPDKRDLNACEETADEHRKNNGEYDRDYVFEAAHGHPRAWSSRIMSTA